jgi:DNA processing protein
VVSGLALGIDAAAHHGAVAGAAPPAAVVGGGVDAPGPATNAALARQVIERGVVLSEAPPGTRPEPWRFPVRNRILAGLARVVVVVESSERGGSMHTVEQAQRRDRTVLAVPGPADSPVSAGTNGLLRDGAGVCTGPDDVLVALGLSSVAPPPGAVDDRPQPDGDAGRVLELLGFTPVPVESLARELDLDLSRLSLALGELESLGWAERRGPFVERVARGGAGP